MFDWVLNMPLHRFDFDCQAWCFEKQENKAMLKILINVDPAGIHLLKVNNRNTRTKCEVYSKLKIKTPERRQ